jgi:hypothetical protein
MAPSASISNPATNHDRSENKDRQAPTVNKAAAANTQANGKRTSSAKGKT